MQYSCWIRQPCFMRITVLCYQSHKTTDVRNAEQRLFEPSDEILVFMASEGGLLTKTRAHGRCWDPTRFFFQNCMQHPCPTQTRFFGQKNYACVFPYTTHNMYSVGHIMKCCGYIACNMDSHVITPPTGSLQPFFLPEAVEQKGCLLPLYAPPVRSLCGASAGPLQSLHMASAGPL